MFSCSHCTTSSSSPLLTTLFFSRVYPFILIFIEIPLLLRICPTSANFDAFIRRFTTNYMRAAIYGAMSIVQWLSIIIAGTSLIAAAVVLMLAALCYLLAGVKGQGFVGSKTLGGQGVAQMIVWEREDLISQARKMPLVPNGQDWNGGFGHYCFNDREIGFCIDTPGRYCHQVSSNAGLETSIARAWKWLLEGGATVCDFHSRVCLFIESKNKSDSIPCVRRYVGVAVENIRDVLLAYWRADTSHAFFCFW